MTLPHDASLPETYPQAAMRGGIRCRCPRCGEGPLFRKWLKPVDRCSACGQDWSLQRADDFPAYVSILVTGHLLAPLLVDPRRWITQLSVPVDALPSSCRWRWRCMLGLLQPAKGAIIAAQWWFGLARLQAGAAAATAGDARPP